ncbi:hypothetical protein GIB67_039565 [Kingdonia uniflora]|uniref:Kinesin light chain n=1 Tax=Kingdonia uniflora TaxID=39325 RepID=A0A7J7P6E6_9MAGN|nr:hypothetical protein GIB67_039565 [Kingdonia uniflora]
MRRASSSLLSHLKHQNNITTTISPKHLSRDISSNNITPTTPITTEQSSQHCNITHGLLLNTHFKTNQSHQFFQRNLNTHFEKPLNLNSRQRKIKDEVDAVKTFESAMSISEIMKAFPAVEAALDKNDPKLGLACLKVSLQMEKEGTQPEKTFEFASRALKILDSVDKDGSLSVAMTLDVMGSTCFSLKMFNDSLGYLNRANRVLRKLESEGQSFDDIGPVMCAVLLGLANTKTAMGRREEALVDHKSCLELQEKLLDANSREIGVANRELAEAYVAVLNFNEALPHCLKALDIHKNELGNNSVEVAHDRRLLGVIYTGLDEHEKALEQNQLSRNVLKNWGLKSDLLRAEIDAANMQIALGKYDNAIDTLKGVVQQTDKESMTRAMIFIAMANALSNQEKIGDAKKCLEISCGILSRKESASPEEVAEAYMEISMLYEVMNELEIAISLLKRLLSVVKKVPQEQHLEGNASARIGWLYLLTGKVKEAIPYLESAVERLKESFGPKHFGIGYIYNNMGAAYLELDRPQSAAQMFALAKDIMDVSLGPHHTDTIDTYQNLSKAYGAMGSYDLAIKFQQNVIQAWGSHGPSAVNELEVAKQVLEELKNNARGPTSDGVPAKTSPLPDTNEFLSSKS